MGAITHTQRHGVCREAGLYNGQHFPEPVFLPVVWFLLVSRSLSSKQTNHGTHPENLILAKKRYPLQNL